LVEESDERAQTLGGLWKVSRAIWGESGEIPVYEVCIDLADGRALFVYPWGTLLSGTPKTLDTT
jgi:hypothetical protein